MKRKLGSCVVIYRKYNIIIVKSLITITRKVINFFFDQSLDNQTTNKKKLSFTFFAMKQTIEFIIKLL